MRASRIGEVNEDGPECLPTGLEGIIGSSAATEACRSVVVTWSAGGCVSWSSISDRCEAATKVASEIPVWVSARLRRLDPSSLTCKPGGSRATGPPSTPSPTSVRGVRRLLCPGLGPAGAVDGTVDGSDSLSSQVQQMETRKGLPEDLPDLLLIANATESFFGYWYTSSSQEGLKVYTSNETRERVLRTRLDKI